MTFLRNLSSKQRLRLLQIAALLAIVASLFKSSLFPKSSYAVFYTPIDFVAFYCGGSVATHGADPYLAGPLRACEDAQYFASGFVSYKNVVTPAPLPPYAFALFGAIALLPIGPAALLWLLIELGSTIVIAALTSRLSGVRSLWIPLAAVGAVIIASVPYGQLAPIAIAALIGAAASLRENRVWLAAALIGLSAIEPHLAASAIVAMLLLVPRMRLPISAVLAILGATSLAFGGLTRTIEYLFVVLPAHVRGESLEFKSQYSLSALLHTAGLPPEVAMQFGSLSYFVMISFGLYLAYGLARNYSDSSLYVLVPVTCAVLGGPFVHIHQIAIALPLAFYLVREATGRSRALLIAAIFCLAVPFQTIAEGPLQRFFPPSPVKPVNVEAVLARVGDPNVLAEVPWDAWVYATMGRDRRNDAEMFLTKLPTWFALGVIVVISTLRLRPALATARNGAAATSA